MQLNSYWKRKAKEIIMKYRYSKKIYLSGVGVAAFTAAVAKEDDS